jgi:hypothetical protein
MSQQYLINALAMRDLDDIAIYLGLAEEVLNAEF